MLRITHGSVQTRRYPRRSLSPHPRRTCTHAAFRALVMPNGLGAVIDARWIAGSPVSRRGLVGGRIRVAARTWVWR
jgi:hypothetical protein